MKTPKKIYLAGPFRGKPKWNALAFHEATERLEAAGWHVFNPHRITTAMGYGMGSVVDTDRAHLTHVMTVDLASIATADALAVLPGWEQSVGCTVEVAYAQWLGLPIYDAMMMKRLDVPPTPWAAYDNIPTLVSR